MPRPKPDTAFMLDAMADHVLAEGLNTASLRPLAKAAGTSDRMLIYHFGSKDALIEVLLARLAERMALGLDAALPEKSLLPPAELLKTVVALLRLKLFAPYARVWLDIVSSAGQGGTAQVKAGHAVIDGFVDWLVTHLSGPEATRRETAMLMLTVIEGVLVMDAVGQQAVSDTAVERLSAVLSDKG